MAGAVSSEAAVAAGDRDTNYATVENIVAYEDQQVWAEPLIAEAKEWVCLRHCRLRGPEKVNGEALLIATGQNLKRVLPFPSGDAE